MMINSLTRAGFLASTALAGAFAPAIAHAQGAADTGLEEIVVTAQKREQSLQDVPIAVTAVTQENLQANRIYTVNDLSAIAPGLTVKPSAGGISTPSFTMRGQVSFGVVAGSDKQVSIYLDGVYIGSPRGSIFELPDIARLEVLRGPQGTLFGRNATAGAVSVTTRDPSGEARLRVEGTYGNYDAYRIRVTAETPQIGPFSALFSYVRNYRRGEIRNAQGGLPWDRTLSPDPMFAKRTTSSMWLGTVDTNSYFAAVKFEPTDNFRMVYKYDRNDDHGTPEGTALNAWDRNFGGNLGGLIQGGLVGNVLTALITSNNVNVNPSGKRPDVVDNMWVIPRDQRVEGHSLTATWNATDSITVKNILAYRKVHLFAPSSIDGAGPLFFTQQTVAPFAMLTAVQSVPGFVTILAQAAGGDPVAIATRNAILAGVSANLQPLVGMRAFLIDSQASSVGDQWSDEIIVNYTSDRLNLTLGGIWFHSDDESGGPVGMQNTIAFGTFMPGNGLVLLGNEGRSFTSATSLAAYAQIEYKITPQFEIVAGARITWDKKTARFRYDIRNPQTGVVSPRPVLTAPDYSRTKPNFLIGFNWKPNPETLVYGKFSTSFVSGGNSVGIPYEPETARSFEVGVKADMFDRKLRANLALFHVTYNHFQSPQSTNFPQSQQIALNSWTPLFGATTAQELLSAASTFVIDQGTVRAKGFELELTAAPTRGLTMGTGIGFTDVEFPYINPVVLAGNGGRMDITARPKWTVSLFASYETRPLWDDTTLQFRMDGQYRSKILFAINPTNVLYADGSNANGGLFADGFMLVNGRIALRNIQIGPALAELAVWGKNITNRKDATFSLQSFVTSNNFVQPRTFGVDLNLEF